MGGAAGNCGIDSHVHGQFRNRDSQSRGRGVDGRAYVEAEIMRTAARQHGLITRAQLRALGLSRDIIDNRVKSRRLRRFRRGVYLIGPTTPPLAPEMGAILSCP